MPRPSARLRVSWPLILLVAGLGCTVLALIETERSARSNQAVADRALMGYANFAAWSYQEHFSEAMRVAVQEALGSVNMFHTNPRIPEASRMGHSVTWNDACQCHAPKFGPLPIAFVGFTLGSDTLAVGYNNAPVGMQGWLGDAPEPALGRARPPTVFDRDDRLWVNAELTRLARAPLSRWGYQVFIGSRGDSTVAFAMTNMPTAWGDTIVYAVQYSGKSIDSMLAVAFDDRDLLPSAIAVKGSNREILVAEVRDRSGRVLFSSMPGRSWALDAYAKLPLSYGGLTIRTQIRPELAPGILIGGLPASRLPLVLALFALATGLTAIAVVQLRREAKFARDRSAFVASTSHELRTPLAQIRLVIDMLRLDREKDPVRREASLALVDREVTRLQHLVDTVLRFARGAPGPDAGREPIDVAVESRHVVSEFLPLARPRGVSIDVHADASLVARLRAGAVRQVLLNLLDNAVKYGPDGQTIAVTVARIGPEGVRIAVRDAGPGVPVAERERIWGAFERGSAADARASGGSGIGLTVVREIAEQHGGRAWVETPAGPGALFVVELPGEA